jgi:hypothetical protein
VTSKCTPVTTPLPEVVSSTGDRPKATLSSVGAIQRSLSQLPSILEVHSRSDSSSIVWAAELDGKSEMLVLPCATIPCVEMSNHTARSGVPEPPATGQPSLSPVQRIHSGKTAGKPTRSVGFINGSTASVTLGIVTSESTKPAVSKTCLSSKRYSTFLPEEVILVHSTTEVSVTNSRRQADTTIPNSPTVSSISLPSIDPTSPCISQADPTGCLISVKNIKAASSIHPYNAEKPQNIESPLHKRLSKQPRPSSFASWTEGAFNPAFALHLGRLYTPGEPSDVLPSVASVPPVQFPASTTAAGMDSIEAKRKGLATASLLSPLKVSARLDVLPPTIRSSVPVPLSHPRTNDNTGGLVSILDPRPITNTYLQGPSIASRGLAMPLFIPQPHATNSRVITTTAGARGAALHGMIDLRASTVLTMTHRETASTYVEGTSEMGSKIDASRTKTTSDVTVTPRAVAAKMVASGDIVKGIPSNISPYAVLPDTSITHSYKSTAPSVRVTRSVLPYTPALASLDLSMSGISPFRLPRPLTSR